MSVNKEKIRYILQFFFDKGENASQAAEIVNGVYGPDNKIIEVDRHVSSRSIAQELKIDHKTVLNHLHKVGFKKKLDVWVLHQLTTKNMMDRISICEALAKRNEIDPFLKRMVTGDEKWVTYDNIVRKRSWSKRDEVAQMELLPYGQTLNSDLYCQQLERLKLTIDQKWPELANRRGVVFHKNNARSHTSVVTRQKLWELGWEVLMHPSYSPDLAPSDYHLFLTMQKFLSDKKSASREDCENQLLEFFANKDPRLL
ncbi:histone-lysine N-methyltransferase SETMAR-like [Vespa crabro]|uniref:histone-lysine N-methyltransferase SETMAR-like n=1 Tax=Vespa crabro TaxID=7445 RepID=UPI001EFFFC71|nr:histone-lysine N-methyltransferase SETMAR-like [Vespa crabro]